MKMQQHIIVRGGRDVGATYDRMLDIVALISDSQADRPVIEYSALICAGVMVIAASRGVDLSSENLSPLFERVIRAIVPAVESEFGGEFGLEKLIGGDR